jgi:transposase-like protein
VLGEEETVVDTTMEPLAWLRKQLEAADVDLLREMVAAFIDRLMGAEVDALCGAPYGERSPERVNSRNGYRTRDFDTRTGTIELQVPKLRSGSYYPDWLLERRRRAERALVAVVAECYVRGVSTRRVDGLIKTLGIDGISKSQVSALARSLDEAVAAFRSRPLDGAPYTYVWLDALTMRVREAGRIAQPSAVIATAVNADGHREILGVDLFTSEDRAGWTAFLRGLVARGLSGVRLVISDDHAGLVTAIAAVLPGASWQRCRTHFVRNLLTRVPKGAQPFVATLVRSIFAQPSREEVEAQHVRVLEQLVERFPAAAELLECAREDILAFRSLPFEHWRHAC